MTTSGRVLPTNQREIIDEFLNACNDNFSCNVPTDRNTIINMDETSIYLDNTVNYSLALTGSERYYNWYVKVRIVLVATTGGQKLK